ncbi:hypothetical protein LINGRAPRIM_LOCUS114 [Linum grandiflorum]
MKLGGNIGKDVRKVFPIPDREIVLQIRRTTRGDVGRMNLTPGVSDLASRMEDLLETNQDPD